MLAIGLVLLLLEGSAMAGIQLGSNTIQRSRSHDGYPYHISKADCESDDDVFTFTILVDQADVNSGTLQVWASASSDCTLKADRTQGNANDDPSDPTTYDDNLCQRVVGDNVPSGAPAQQNPFTIKSREIADKISSITYDEATGTCTDSSGNPAARQVFLTVMLVKEDTDIDASYAVKFPVPDKFEIYVDLTAPAPPTNITATSSEQAVVVGIENETPPPADLAGYYIYCDPPAVEDGGSAAAGCSCLNVGDLGGGGSAGSSAATTTSATTTTTAATTTTTTTTGGMGATGGMPGAGGAGGTGGMTGAGGTGGAGGMGGSGAAMGGMGGSSGMSGTTTTSATTTTTGATGGMGGSGGATGSGGDAACAPNIDAESGACTSCILSQGEDPPGDAYLCGEIKGTGPTGLASVLQNGRYNAVAVAAYDLLGNVGKLSVEKCALPTEVQDFYEEYRDRGGKGGGGCSVQSRSRPFSAAGPLLGVLAGAALVLRRRRRARAEARTGGGVR